MERIEEYLEAILDIQEEEKRVVRTTDVARRLNVKPSSVTEMFAKLREMGYVDYVPYKGVILTQKGREVAEKIKKYYRIFEMFFKFLGVDEGKAKELGCELEHHVDDEVIDRICRFIAGTCNICDECKYDECILSDVEKGLYEILMYPVSLKDFLNVRVIEVLENNDVVKIKIGDEPFEISKGLAKKIVVKKV